jgi:FKBP-type peptidyl-prolyl cis-trans isomerase FklB
MKKLVFFAVFCFAAVGMVSFSSCSGSGAGSVQTPKANLKTAIDSLSYAYGVSMTQGLDEYIQRQMGIEAAYKEDLIKGMLDGANGKEEDKKAAARLKGLEMGKQLLGMLGNVNKDLFLSDSTQTLNKSQFLAGFAAAVMNKDLLMKKDDVQTYVQTTAAVIRTKASEKVKTENQAFLDENKAKTGVQTLPSGLQYKVVKEGKGPKPAVEDTVLVNYVLSDIHNKQLQKNDSIKFNVNRVIPGWTEGMQLMSPGAKYTFYVPYNLGYGEQGNPPAIMPFSTLVFDVELLSVSPAVAPAVKK